MWLMFIIRKPKAEYINKVIPDFLPPRPRF
jgi:hypothetical protein